MHPALCLTSLPPVTCMPPTCVKFIRPLSTMSSMPLLVKCEGFLYKLSRRLGGISRYVGRNSCVLPTFSIHVIPCRPSNILHFRNICGRPISFSIHLITCRWYITMPPICTCLMIYSPCSGPAVRTICVVLINARVDLRCIVMCTYRACICKQTWI